jgi:hypothetical protein
MPDIRLQAIQREDDAPMRSSDLVEAVWIGPREGHQFLVALQEILDRPRRNCHVAVPQLLMELWETPVLGIAQGAHQGDDIEATLVLGEGEPSFCLWAGGHCNCG